MKRHVPGCRLCIAQEGLGLEAVALVKFFTLDSTWTYWVSEGSPVGKTGT